MAASRHRSRVLARTPAFTVVVLLTLTLTLALGLGANAAVYQLLDAIRLAPLPAGDASRFSA